MAFTPTEELDLITRIMEARKRSVAYGGKSPQQLFEESQIRPASQTSREQILAQRRLAQEYTGLEETNVPGTVTGAVGNFREHPVMGSLEIALMGMNPGFFKGGILATSGKEYARNAATGELTSLALQEPAAAVANPETHPWLNLGANLALWAGLGRGVEAGRGVLDARREVLGKSFELPGLLGSERGSVAVGPGGDTQPLWDKLVGAKISALGNQVAQVPLLPKDSRVARYMGGNTLSDMGTSPVLRMPSEAGKLFERTQTEGERTANALRESALRATNLNLSEREDLREVLKRGMNISVAKPENQAKIADILSPIESSKVITSQKLFTDASKEKLAGQELDKRLLNLFVEDVQDPMWQIRKANTTHDLTTSEGTKAFLDGVITDPLSPPSAKVLAYDMYDIAAKTGQEVADAHRNSYEKLLASTIKNNPDWAVPQDEFMQAIIDAHPGGIPDKTALKAVNDKLSQFVEISAKPGKNKVQVPSMSGDFEGMLVHRDVAEGLRDLDTTVSNFRRGWNRYFLNPWKFMKIGLNVPARARDFLSNIMFNDIAGAHPLSPYRVDVYGNALNDIRKASKGNTSPDLERFFYYSGGKADSLNSVATDPVFAAMRHDANPIDNLLGNLYSSRIGQISSNLMKNTDLWAKYAKFKWNLSKGMPEEDAAIDAIRTVGDHTKQSRAVRNIRDTMMPFFGWQAHSLRQIGHGMAHHPVRTMKWYLAPIMAAQYGISKLGMTKDDYEQFKQTLPDYMSQEVAGVPTHIPVPFRDEKGRIQMMDLAWWLPGLQDLSELGGNLDNPMKFMQNPAFTSGAALLNNKKFSGAPIWNEWDEPGTKVSKALGYVGQQFSPPMMPGLGNQFQKIWGSYNEDDPKALTPAQAWGTQAGVRITPIDEGEQQKKYKARLNAWEGEAKYQMREELKRTTDPAKQEKIVEEYMDIINKLKEQKNLGGSK